MTRPNFDTTIKTRKAVEALTTLGNALQHIKVSGKYDAAMYNGVIAPGNILRQATIDVVDDLSPTVAARALIKLVTSDRDVKGATGWPPSDDWKGQTVVAPRLPDKTHPKCAKCGVFTDGLGHNICGGSGLLVT